MFIGRSRAGDMAGRALAIFALAAVFWAAEALPLFVTALVVGLEIVLLASDGGLAEEVTRLFELIGITTDRSLEITPISAAAFVVPFASDIIMLFLGGLLLAAAVTKHGGVDAVLAARILRPFTRSPLVLLYGVAGLSAFFSMWMSNTATAAMMIALAGPTLSQLPAGERFRTALLLQLRSA